MSDSKNLLTFVVSASIAVLIAVCLGLFWLTWTSLEETERVKEENHQLLLGNTVCKLRLDNLQQGGRGAMPAITEEALEAVVKAQAAEPVPAPLTTEAAAKLKTAETAVAKPAPAPEARPAQPPAQPPVEPTAAPQPQPAAAPASRPEIVLMPSDGTVKTAAQESAEKAPAANEAQAAAASAPAAQEEAPAVKPVLKNPWYVQLGAYAREAQAKDYALDAEDILAEAGLAAKAFVVKRKTRWLVCLDEPLTRPKALQAAEKVKAAGVDAVIIRLPQAK